jgi:uncharacterized protein (DUF58 family)
VFGEVTWGLLWSGVSDKMLSVAGESSASSFVDPAALMRIRSLELRARVVMEGLWKGLHRSPYHGFSVEFSEYRPYVRGDDPRHIDWKLAGRSGRYFVKKFEDETNLRCQLVVDHSRSMKFGSAGGMTKADYAATLAATLALFLMKQGDAVGVTTFASGLAEHVPARNRPGHLRRLMLELERPVQEGGTALDVSMTQLSELLTKKGLVCLFSDLLAPVDKLERQLSWLGAMGQDVVVFHLMDRAEIEFRFEEVAVFQDAESGVERFVNPGVAREGYLARLKAHCDAVRLGCERAGVEYQWCPTDTPLEVALFDFVSRRDGAKAGKKRVSGGGR